MQLAILGLLCVANALAAPDDSYVILAGIAPSTRSTPFRMPPGCTCRVSGVVNDERCEQFDCPCQCDLIAGACDMNCCCDQECSNKDLSSFSHCLDEGGVPSMVKMCTERPPSLEDVNLRNPMRLSDYPEDKLHGFMCVEYDNSAVQGNYFGDQGYPPASEVFSPGGMAAKQIGFHSHSRGTMESSQSNTHYQLGDPIVAFQQGVVDQSMNKAFGGYLVLPSSDDGGYCIELNTVAFGKSETSACVKHINNLATDCESLLGAVRYVSNVFVENTIGAFNLNPSNALIPISIGTYVDSSGIVYTGPTAIPPQTKWDNSSLVCTNALKRMTYNVRHNSTSILDISVDIDTLDIVPSTRNLMQEFTTKFIPDDVAASDRSHDKNNIISRVRSGNPGYIVGAPTLGAKRTLNPLTSSFVIAQKAGFSVMDTGLAGQCSASSTSGSSVGFAKNMFVGCTQSFTRNELKEFCLDPTNQHPMLARQKVDDGNNFVFPRWLQTNQDYLGIFGNSDPLDKRQWIEIEFPTAFSWSRSFVEADNRCVGMPTRLRYNILWTYVGNVNDPQAKILSVKRSFEDDGSLQHTRPVNEKQPFSFVTTVSWSFAEPTYELVKSPPPLYIFSLPYDVFYPFTLGKE